MDININAKNTFEA